MVFGPVWIAMAVTLFLGTIPVAYFREKRWGWGVVSGATLFVMIVVHPFVGWRIEEDPWGWGMFDLPFALMTFVIMGCLAMMPFRLHRCFRPAVSIK